MFAEALEGVGDLEVNAETARPDTAALVAHFLRGARSDVAGGEVAVTRVFPFQIVIAVGLGNPARRLRAIHFSLRHPNAAIVAQRLGHQREFRLMVAADRYASRM